MTETRIDKWLWAARFFKTRSLATDAVDLGRVLHQGVRCKPARAVKCGDVIAIDRDGVRWEVEVVAIADVRGPAAVAQTLYRETEAGLAARERAQQQKKLMPEPAAQRHGRPTKRDRRQLDQLH